MTRKLLWPVLVIGLALVVVPFAISLPGKASAGQRMIDSFHPIMAPASVAKTVSYYNNTFVPLRAVALGGVQAASEEPKLLSALSSQLHMTPARVEQFLGKSFPSLAKMLASFPSLVPIFTDVPGGLDHYKPLVSTMQANVGNYRQIDSLPDFRLFTWFFVVPGALLMLLAGWGLAAGHTSALRLHLHMPHRPSISH
jgi:hypothetical protein